jgi:hypothetical protein
MTEPQPQTPADAAPAKKPYGPGVLMALGLFLLLVAAWCGYDLATKEEWEEEGKTTAIVFNWVGMIGFGAAAVYMFVLAAVRSKGGGAAAADRPPPPGAGPQEDEEPEPADEPPGDQP